MRCAIVLYQYADRNYAFVLSAFAAESRSHQLAMTSYRSFCVSDTITLLQNAVWLLINKMSIAGKYNEIIPIDVVSDDEALD